MVNQKSVCFRQFICLLDEILDKMIPVQIFGAFVMLPANDCLGKLKADLLVLLDTVVFPSDCIQQNLSLMLRCDVGHILEFGPLIQFQSLFFLAECLLHLKFTHTNPAHQQFHFVLIGFLQQQVTVHAEICCSADGTGSVGAKDV